MTTPRPKTYPMTRSDGTTVRVTVPDDPMPHEMLVDAIRDNLSPEAAAVIVAYLQPVKTNDAAVDRQVRWFSDVLRQTIGADQCNRLCEQLGL